MVNNKKTMKMSVPKTHPRYTSLKMRDRVVDGVKKGITSLHGLTAHGRGEAFDYLLGEKTTKTAKKTIDSAAALLLVAKNPIISVNGNAAALVSEELAQLSKTIPAKLEVNIFHSSKQRELKIKNELMKYGAKEVLIPQNAKVKNKKKVIVVDLNPLSRSSQKATITIVDNIVRAVPLLIKTIKKLKGYNLSRKQLETIIKHHDNKKRLKEALKEINRNLV